MPHQQHITLTIPKPCHEDWKNMTPMARGRYCASCEKLVTDFTQQSPAEIAAYLARHPKENLCGRFTPAQLVVPYTLEPERRPAAWPKWLVAAGLLGGMVVPKVSSGQTLNPPTQANTYLNGPNSFENKKNATKTITGVIKDTDGNPVIGAKVAIGIQLQDSFDVFVVGYSNADGIFNLEIPFHNTYLDLIVKAYSIGYVPRVHNIDSYSYKVTKNIDLILESDVLGEICRRGDIRPRNPFGFSWYYIKYPFKHAGRAVASVFRRRY